MGSTSFLHVRHENLYIVAVTKCNANAALIYEFCYRVINIGKSYFGKFDEEAVKNNFVLIYELLDGGRGRNIFLLDVLDASTCRSILTAAPAGPGAQDSSKITIQATGATSWRRADIKYRKNEAFVDVIESVNLIMSQKGALAASRRISVVGAPILRLTGPVRIPWAEGTVLRADVTGRIMMRAYLSGTPECKFGLNDKVLLEREPKSR
ncbi:MAG: Mu homology domain-containing protein [Olpidium bornovanus]|uniref:Mu homology domain-containing protein n=1 Tax=Olpidium bornovanus TaxID=278681 RepID=A0A8H8A149_9FUNG|nr:MAG: Mu homology domain-containing protein [Olpidium bornovanus]